MQRNLLTYVVHLPLLILFLSTVKAADCKYSCPSSDSDGFPLIHHPGAVAYDSELQYSVFECVYAASQVNLPLRSCAYFKDSGTYALGSRLSRCMATATPCEADYEAKFSSTTGENAEVMRWVETGRDHHYYMEHPPV